LKKYACYVTYKISSSFLSKTKIIILDRAFLWNLWQLYILILIY
jgi:hypothetical protein